MEEPKVLAYYLPAYHEIEENNKWYGKGFTEWDNTKKGKPLFKKHYQPRVPKEYYDLSDPEVIKSQMRLARNYGVDGFIYYHYWFDESGRTVLQKPVEMMHQLEFDEKIEYCFCWANQSWKRTWGETTGKEEMLIEQKYGAENDWGRHFDYFLPYFKDKKYIKFDNKPVLFIYKAEDIPNYENMIQFWSRRAINEGFDGIFVVRMLTEEKVANISIKADADVAFEPNYTIGSRMSKNMEALWRIKTFIYWHIIRKTFISKYMCNTINYNSFYKTLIKHQKQILTRNKKSFIGCFTDWDNSPRKGRRGIIMTESSPEFFKVMFNEIYGLAKEINVKAICIFAWNEWGEGGYLEPDTRYNTKYLEALMDVKQRYGDI